MFQIVGHSLGGGTASLLTYILREQKEFASATCFTFAPGTPNLGVMVVFSCLFCHLLLSLNFVTKLFICQLVLIVAMLCTELLLNNLQLLV